MIISATGHRPEKLGGYGDQIHRRLVKLATDYLLINDPDEVVSGMALGWDSAVAEAALCLCIPLTAAVPFEGQERLWPRRSQERYRGYLREAADVRIISPGGYIPEKMQKRNIWMVNQAGRMLALWNGSAGGTANCLEHARQLGLPIDNLWREFRP